MKKQKMRKLIILGMLVCSLFTYCQIKQEKLAPLNLDKALIRINDCGVTYKGKQLPFGADIEAWEKILGQKRRRPDFGMFDNLGVAVQIDDTPDKEATFYVFFTNLDSPEGQAGKLSKAYISDMKSFEEIENEYKELDKPMSKELITRIKKGLEDDLNPTQYFYPYYIFQGVVDVQGAPIAGDLNLQKINAYRAQTKKLDIFTFWDRNVNMEDETMTTEGKSGEYYQTTDTECNGKLYRIALFFTNAKLEYLRVEKLSKSDLEMIKKLKE